MKKILNIIVVILMLLFVGVVGINLYIDNLLNKIQHEQELSESEAGITVEIIKQKEKANVENIVLFGLDNDGDKSEGKRSDAIKIISLDLTNKKIKVSSLERDLVVYLPNDHDRYAHLNWAHWFGGAELAIQTINHNFDMDITKYVSFSFDSVEEIVDLVDGVDISLTKSEMSVLRISGNAGTYTLNGKQALAYSRIRKLDSDYQRMQRQQNVIDGVVEKVTAMSYTELLSFINDGLEYVKTNISNQDIKDYALTLLDFDLDIKTLQIPSKGYEDTCRCPNLGGYLVRSYQDMSQDLHDFIYGEGFYTPSETLLNNQSNIYEKYGYCE